MNSMIVKEHNQKKKDKNNANISVYILIIYNTAHKLMTGDL